MTHSLGVKPQRPWALVATLGFAATTVSYMQTLVVPIQNHLPALVDAPRSATAWVLTVTLVVAAVTTPISGRLGDLYGRRNVSLVLLGLLIAGSLVAAVSQDLWGLLIGRALQGTGMGLIALGISILGGLSDQRHSVTGIAFISASLGFGGALGLPLAGLIAEWGDWKMLFWSTAVLGSINLLATWLVVPHSPGTWRRVDYPGAVGLAIGLSGILIAISQGHVWGWASVTTIGSALGGAGVLVVWAFFELRVAEPIVDLRVLSRRPLLFVSLGTILFGFSFFVMEVSFLQILELPAGTQAGVGLSMVMASLALVPSALVMMAIAPFSARLTNRFGGRIAACSGALTVAVGYALTLVLHEEAWQIVITSSVLCAGVAVGYAAIPTLVMAEVSATETGSANGVNALMRSIGTSSGATVTGMVLAAHSAPVDGNEVPALSGFMIVFALGMVAAVGSAALIWLSKRAPRPGSS